MRHSSACWRRLVAEPKEITDDELVAITAGLHQFADALDQMAAYAVDRGKPEHPGQELYWGGVVEGLRMAATAAREMRPLRGVK